MKGGLRREISHGGGVNEVLLIDLQILLQVLLFVLFGTVSRLVPGWGFMRWWTWAWAALAFLLVLHRLSLAPGIPDVYTNTIYPHTSPVVALLQVALFLLGSIGLIRGRAGAERATRPVLLGAVAMGVVVTVAGETLLLADEALEFAFRALPRSAGLAVVLPICAYAFWRNLPSQRTLPTAVAPLGFLLYAANQLAYTAAALAELLRGGMGLPIPEAFGAEFIFSSYATLSDIAWTGAIGLGTVAILVGEVRRVQGALQESEHRFREVFHRAPTGMALLDARGTIRSANRALRKLLNRSEGEMKGISMEDLAHPEDGEAVGSLIAGATAASPEREEPVDVSRALLFVRKDGAVVQTHATPAVVHPAWADEPEIVLQLADVTELRALEQHLRQAQRLEAVGSLATGLAHDFNNILQAIGSNTELVLLDHPDDASVRTSLEEIRDAVQRGHAINNQILAFAGKASVREESVDLRTFFVEVEEFLQSILPESVTLGIELQESPKMQGDPERLLQLLSNLVSNAGDAMEGTSGTVHVRADEVAAEDLSSEDSFLPETPSEGSWTRLTVSDTGGGMDEETLERVYEPFFTTRFIGRGLGLPASLGIVRAHGGAMKLESRVGEGTVATVLLPPAPRSVREPVERYEAGSDLSEGVDASS